MQIPNVGVTNPDKRGQRWVRYSVDSIRLGEHEYCLATLLGPGTRVTAIRKKGGSGVFWLSEDGTRFD